MTTPVTPRVVSDVLQSPTEWHAYQNSEGSAGNGRELLTANRTYYVRTDGNDSNDGTANTAGGAWLTIQHAIDTISSTLDFSSGYSVVVQVADGTYDEKIILRPLLGAGARQTYSSTPPDAGLLFIVGNASDRTLVEIKPTTQDWPASGGELVNADGIQVGYEFWYIHFDGTDPGFGEWHIVQLIDSWAAFQQCKFSKSSASPWFTIACWRSFGRFNHPTFDVGSTQDSLFNIDFGSQVNLHGTVTLSSGTPNFIGAVFNVDLNSIVYLNGVTFSGWGTPAYQPYYLARGSGIAVLGSTNIPGTADPYVDYSSYYSPQFGETYSGDYYFYQPNIRTKITADTTYYVRTVPATVTVTIATPAVVSWASHGLAINDAVVFNTSGALPTGLTVGTVYYVISTGFGASSFQVSTSVGGAAVNTSGTQSGTHTAQTGDDSNTGLAQTVAGAFLTIQQAINTVAAEIDFGHNWTVVIQLADGVYDEQLLLKPLVGAGGHFGTFDTTDAGQAFIVGNSGSHASVTIRPTTVGFENRIVYANVVNNWEFWYCKFDGTNTTFSGGSSNHLIGLINSLVSFHECNFALDDNGNKTHIFDLIGSKGRFQTLDFDVDGTVDAIFWLNQSSSAFSLGAMTLLSGTPVMTNGFYNVDNSTFRLDTVSYVGWGSIACVPYTLSESANLNTIFTSGFPGTLLPYIDTTSAFNSRHGWISPLETQAVSGSIGFKQDTTTSNAEIGSSIHSVATDTTGGSEDFYLSFRNMNAGATAAELMRLEKTAVAGDTALMLYDVDNNTVERVSVGIADSGGAGFKVLRIPN